MVIIKFLLASLLGLGLCDIAWSQSMEKKIEVDDPGAYVQRMDSFNFKDEFKPLHLNDVIEQGLRQNHDQFVRKYQNKILDLGWKDTYSTFWYPTVDLTLSTGVQRVDRIKNGSKNGNPASDVPSGTLALSLGEYTIFNWGKDYLAYLNQKTTFVRAKERILEGQRILKHDLVIQYFELAELKEIENIYKYQLRQASFIYRLNKEKVLLRKITKQEYYQSRAEYLRSQQTYYEAKVKAELADERMSFLLNDPPGTRYILNEKLKYKKLRTSLEESNTLSEKHSPNVLTSIADLEVSKKEYEIELKENLPLPKFTLNLGAYTNTFGNSLNQVRYETSPLNSNLEIVASINATWSLVGTGGFFNQRRTETKFINRDLATRNLTKNKHFVKSELTKIYRNIMNLEKLITIMEAQTSNLKKTYDTILDNYTQRKASFIELQKTLEDLTEADSFHEEKKFEHLREKITLAKTIGIEDFPGENFEDLVDKEISKGSAEEAAEEKIPEQEKKEAPPEVQNEPPPAQESGNEVSP